MISILRFMKPYLGNLIILFLAVALQVWSGIALPALMAEIVNKGIMGQNIGLVWQSGAVMVGYAFLGALGALLASYFSARISAAIGRDMRSEVFAKILAFSVQDVNKFSTASLITRTTNDIARIQNVLVMALSMLMRAPMMAVGAIIQAVATAPSMTWIIVLAISVMASVSIIIIMITMPKFSKYQKMVDKIAMIARENLTGIRVIRAFNNQKHEQKKFDNRNQKLVEMDWFIGRMMSLWNPLLMLVFNGTMLLCIWIGINRMGEDMSYLGNMMAFMQYAMQVIMSFIFLTMLMVSLPRANVSARRVNEVLKTQLRIKWKEETEGEVEGEPKIEFRKVSFKYDKAEENVLTDISFVAKVGETTAIIGSTGSGKSTLVNLMMRFQDASDGEVRVNGVNVKNYSEKDLMKKIGYVSQKSFLFGGTIFENVGFGMKKTEKTVVEEAVMVAQARDFVLKKEQKYQSKVAQSGKNLSGGQRQRLSIARAIAKDPDILIFDDAFSALDMKTDENLRREIEKIAKEKVVVIVGQRINTVKRAEQIIVLDQGRMVGRGSHSELILKSKVYQEIAKSQMSEKEYAEEMERVKNGR